MEYNRKYIRDHKEKIYLSFYNEWKERKQFYTSWEEFIKSKNIGIIISPESFPLIMYEIVDEKKWMLTKIKYGI